MTKIYNTKYYFINLYCQIIAGMVFAQNKHVDELGGPKTTQYNCGKRNATCDQCGTFMCASRNNKTSNNVRSVEYATRWNGFAKYST